MQSQDDTVASDTNSPPSDPDRRAGWSSSFPVFRSTPARIVVQSLKEFLADASEGQVRAWRDSVPRLQLEVGEVLDAEARAERYTSILEFVLPLDSRRADAVFLVAGAVIVLELKGKERPTQADLDQAAAYARDLRAYHRECLNRPVHAVLVPTRAHGAPVQRDGVWIAPPEAIDGLVMKLVHGVEAPPPDAANFLDPEAYSPLPTLVQAARELFHSGELREVWRARAATDPAVHAIRDIAHEAALTRTRHLVLVTGVPGSGKTLVGMRAVHAGYLDDLAVERANGKPATPGLYLSGNGPLVEVLQHVLRSAGGGGRTFVRHIKDYLHLYVPRPEREPLEHLLVFDEAQRAFTAERVREVHKEWPARCVKSEPELFVEVCDRMPEWCVLVGLIGTGQEIHLGEEGGLAQWRRALEQSAQPWTVHAPADLERIFHGSRVATRWTPGLSLNTTLRSHLASELHDWVGDLLDETPTRDDASIAADHKPAQRRLDGFDLWATRDLEVAKSYLRDRYASRQEARFGMLASSRDRLLESFGIENGFQATSRMRIGPWYADGDDSELACRRLTTCATEFGAQGLELDMALVCWGSDFVRERGEWSIARARKYQRGRTPVLDPRRLRVNAYRVLLTRGRDGMVVYVPDDRVLDETWDFLLRRGLRELPDDR